MSSETPQQWFYVTGCDTGFGNVVAKMLAERGFGVFAGVYSSKTTFEGNFKGKIVTVPLDVSKDDSVTKAGDIVREHLKSVGKGGLDGLVNNAGILIESGPCEWVPMKAYEQMFQVNVMGTVRVTNSVLPLIRQARGRIVNVASLAGRMGLESQPAYCVSKFGVEAYSDVLRRDMIPWDVTVSIIEPGVFHATGLYDRFQSGFDKIWENLPSNLKEDYGQEFYEYYRKKLGLALHEFGNPNNDLVPLSMIEALTAQRPQYRYRVGHDSKYMVTVLEKCHESTQDAVLLMDHPKLKSVKPAKAPKDANGRNITAQGRYEKNWRRTVLMAVALWLLIRWIKK